MQKGTLVFCEFCNDSHRVTKKRVDMERYFQDDEGNQVVQTNTENVRLDVLDKMVSYFEKHWDKITVSKEFDAGPNGYHGETYIPRNINHDLAGKRFPADKIISDTNAL